MAPTKENIEKAKKLAEENYSTWGQWVIECYTDSELGENLEDFRTIEEWVKVRQDVAGYYKEIESTAW